jgi:hypothetical protein
MFFNRGVCTDFTILDSPFLAEIAECLFRGWALASAALGVSTVIFWIFKQEGDSQASLGFSVILHAALLFMTYRLYTVDPNVWPGPRDLTGNYLVTRLEPEPKVEPPKPVPTVGQKKEQTNAAATPEKPKNTATRNDEGASGGKGEHERARDPNSKDVPRRRRRSHSSRTRTEGPRQHHRSNPTPASTSSPASGDSLTAVTSASGRAPAPASAKATAPAPHAAARAPATAVAVMPRVISYRRRARSTPVASGQAAAHARSRRAAPA